MRCVSCSASLPEASDYCPTCGAPQRPPAPALAVADPLIGTILKEQYRVDAPIGQGGMGAVYRGFDLNLRRAVAIKVLPEKFNSDKELVERFLREAQAAARLDHPNIVAIHTVATSGQTHFFVMKLIQGQTLSTIVRNRPLDLAGAVPVLEQLCDGLEAIHNAGFVHRDIKSSNVMIEPNGRATLLDFGILRDVEGAGQLTQTGLIVGTPHYMPPEQTRSSKLVDHRSDIYAFGVVMYEVLTGRLPFLAPTVFEILTMHNSEPPVSPTDRIPSIPEGVSAVVIRALAKKKEERFQSVAELREALLTAASAAGVATPVKRKFETREYPLAAPMAAPATVPRTSPTSFAATMSSGHLEAAGTGASGTIASGVFGEAKRKGSERRRTVAWSLAGVAAIAGGVGLFVAFGDSKAPRPEAPAPATAPASTAAPAPERILHRRGAENAEGIIASGIPLRALRLRGESSPSATASAPVPARPTARPAAPRPREVRRARTAAVSARSQAPAPTPAAEPALIDVKVRDHEGPVPDAVLFVDGKRFGTATGIHKVRAGSKLRLVVKKDDSFDEKTQSFKSGETVKLLFKLRESPR